MLPEYELHGFHLLFWSEIVIYYFIAQSHFRMHVWLNHSRRLMNIFEYTNEKVNEKKKEES
jgi:hypothetical protein